MLNQDVYTVKRDGLTKKHVLAYSVGHLGNDLCAAMWFFYLGYYLKETLELEVAAYGMLSG